MASLFGKTASGPASRVLRPEQPGSRAAIIARYTPQPRPGHPTASYSGSAGFPKPRSDYLDFGPYSRPDSDPLGRDDPLGSYDPVFGGSTRPSRPLYGQQSSILRSRDELDFDEDDEESSQAVNHEKRIVNGKPLLVNNEIKARDVRVVGPNKEPLGVHPLAVALEKAAADGMDVVLLNGDQSPPLVRIIAWSKYKFEVEKSAKKKAAGSTVLEMKEIRLRPTTDTNDVKVKVNNVIKFLEKGHKIKLTMRFEGRELQFREQGKEVLLKFIKDLGNYAKVEGPLNFKTGTYTVLLSPDIKTPDAKPAAPAASAAPGEVKAPATVRAI